MADEVKVPIVLTGMAKMRQELKEAKGLMLDLQESKGPDLDAATAKVGELKDKMGDVNDQIKLMSGGTSWEKMANGASLMGTQLKNMDFEGLAASATNMKNIMGKMNPAEIKQGFKDMGSAVADLSKGFMKMALTIMANPLLWIPVAIAAVIAILYILKDKVKVIGDAFDYLTGILNKVIGLLKSLTDAIGLTAFAEEDAADRSVAAAKKRSAAMTKVSNDMEDSYARDLALMKSKGMNTTAFENEHLQQTIKNNKSIIETNKDAAATALKMANESTGKTKEKYIKDYNDLMEDNAARKKVHQDSLNQIKVNNNEHNAEIAAKNKEAGKKSIEDTKKQTQENIDAKKRAYEVEVAMQTSINMAIEDQYTREVAMNKLKKEQDIQKLEDSKFTAKQREKLTETYVMNEALANKKSAEENSKRIVDKAKTDADARQKDIDELNAYQEKLKAAQDSYNDFVIEHGKKELPKKLNSIKKSIEAEQKILTDQYEADKIKFIGKEEELLRIKKEYDAKMGVVAATGVAMANEATDLSNAEEKKKKGEHALEVAGMIAGVAGTINDALNSLDAERLNKVSETHNAEIASIDRKRQEELSVIGLTEEQKKAINAKADKAKYDSDVKMWQATEKIKKEQFARDKAMRMVDIVMSTAAGVMAGYKEGPWIGTVAAAITLAQGAIQLGVVAASKYQGSPGPAAPALGSGGGGSVPSSDALVPAWSPTKKSQQNTTGMEASVNAAQNMIVTAVVSETEITNTQNRVSKMQKSAEL